MDLGIQTIRSALDIALGVSSPYAGPLAQNLASLTMSTGDYRRAFALYEEAWALNTRLSGGVIARWDLAVQARIFFELGRWDEALERCEAFLARSERTPHYLQSQVMAVRAWIQMARGEGDRALAEAGRIEELARQAGDPQVVIAAFGMLLRIALDLGRAGDFETLVAELRIAVRTNPAEAVWYPEFIWLAADAESLGLDRELRAAAAAAPATPWRELLGAALSGDFAREVELLDEMGIVTYVAEARLRLADQLIRSGRRAEGEAQLEQALAFYRSVGATFYIARGEKLLAGAA
jgi:tetratricopeptide (TPR) repeat protein